LEEPELAITGIKEVLTPVTRESSAQRLPLFRWLNLADYQFYSLLMENLLPKPHFLRLILQITISGIPGT